MVRHNIKTQAAGLAANRRSRADIAEYPGVEKVVLKFAQYPGIADKYRDYRRPAAHGIKTSLVKQIFEEAHIFLQLPNYLRFILQKLDCFNYAGRN